MKVLYVEDQPVNVMLMQALFAMRPKMALTVATNGEEGYRAATENPPDLLLVDLRLPDCHGSELLARMRTHPALLRVPAAAVTADVSDLTQTTFMEVWTKPLDLTQTLSRLDQLHARHLEAMA